MKPIVGTVVLVLKQEERLRRALEANSTSSSGMPVPARQVFQPWAAILNLQSIFRWASQKYGPRTFEANEY